MMLLQVYILLLMDKLGNETHLMINKKYNKKQIGIHLDSKQFFSL